MTAVLWQVRFLSYLIRLQLLTYGASHLLLKITSTDCCYLELSLPWAQSVSYLPGAESAGGFSVSVIVPNYRRWREYDSMTSGEITDQAPDYRPDGV